MVHDKGHQMPYHKTGAYDGFDSLEEAINYYRRCRTIKSFILSDDGVFNDNPRCIICKKLVKDKPKPDTLNSYMGNRCQYPKQKWASRYC
jgi:hypothetical protein